MVCYENGYNRRIYSVQYTIDDLVRLARRENNNKRPYLYVNPLQGKHIPADPGHVMSMCSSIADRVNELYPNDKLFVIGFAETATGIAAGICESLNNVIFYQNTTREFQVGVDYLYFTESHSHATDQLLRTTYLRNGLDEIDRIIFIDDEITTGNTIIKLISQLEKVYGKNKLKYSIVSIINSMEEERIKYLAKQGIDCCFLLAIPHEFQADSILNIQPNYENMITIKAQTAYEYDELQVTCNTDARETIRFSDYVSDINNYQESIGAYLKGEKYRRVLVLGTEEFMYPTFCVGRYLLKRKIADLVKVHATTRSPILVSDREGYPFQKRYQIKSLYDEERHTYIYNLGQYDKTLVLTDSSISNIGINDLCCALVDAGNTDITVIQWKNSGRK